ncbi:MAG: aspartyl/asparaginyl beta-hydroxylase domain-containing protein [Bdellovibrionaceae bacterium]|nr:aspartyl/asparaginyl beta-hydroxylase domain-containing protein [Bdellovibrio sp.]
MVQELAYKFDIKRLSGYFHSIRHLGTAGQVSISYRENGKPYQDGLGQAYTDQFEKLFDESDFKIIVDNEANPIIDIIDQVKLVAKTNFNFSIGRIRFMTLSSKSCLSYHRDIESFRFHIPLTTNQSCFFVVNDRVYRMPNPGTLYTLRTDVFHTPVNANKDFERTHLVFSTYPTGSAQGRPTV